MVALKDNILAAPVAIVTLATAAAAAIVAVAGRV